MGICVNAPLISNGVQIVRRQEALTLVSLCKSGLSGYTRSVYAVPPGCYTMLSLLQ